MKGKESPEDEIKFVNHKIEFSRFYENHKKLCDEISGIKKKIWFENGEQKEMEITRSNFLFAIKRLGSFIIDNIHYITDKTNKNSTIQKFSKLEEKYINDTKYHDYVEREKNLDTTERIDFNQKYLNYIASCFDISYELSRLLQESIMAATKEIKGKLSFYNYEGFYEMLAEYRTEMSEDISNFSFKNMLKHFKKILGYYYTYKLMIPQSTIQKMDILINKIFSYIMQPTTLEYIITSQRKNKFNAEEQEYFKREGIFVKRALMEVYKKTNEALSGKNILPKVERQVLIDKTLI